MRATLEKTMTTSLTLCKIPARTLPPCDLKYGHKGDKHSNAGDGFYAPEYNLMHHARQRETSKKKRKSEKAK